MTCVPTFLIIIGTLHIVVGITHIVPAIVRSLNDGCEDRSFFPGLVSGGLALICGAVCIVAAVKHSLLLGKVAIGLNIAVAIWMVITMLQVAGLAPCDKKYHYKEEPKTCMDVECTGAKPLLDKNGNDYVKMLEKKFGKSFGSSSFTARKKRFASANLQALSKDYGVDLSSLSTLLGTTDPFGNIDTAALYKAIGVDPILADRLASSSSMASSMLTYGTFYACDKWQKKNCTPNWAAYYCDVTIVIGGGIGTIVALVGIALAVYLSCCGKNHLRAPTLMVPMATYPTNSYPQNAFHQGYQYPPQQQYPQHQQYPQQQMQPAPVYGYDPNQIHEAPQPILPTAAPGGPQTAIPRSITAVPASPRIPTKDFYGVQNVNETHHAPEIVKPMTPKIEM